MSKRSRARKRRRYDKIQFARGFINILFFNAPITPDYVRLRERVASDHTTNPLYATFPQPLKTVGPNGETSINLFEP